MVFYEKSAGNVDVITTNKKEDKTPSILKKDSSALIHQPVELPAIVKKDTSKTIRSTSKKNKSSFSLLFTVAVMQPIVLLMINLLHWERLLMLMKAKLTRRQAFRLKVLT